MWAEVQHIGWGTTNTYKEVAGSIDTGSTAVAGALKYLDEHPDWLAIIYWHRVIRTDGKLSIRDRTREQAQRLVLEGNALRKRGNTYSLDTKETTTEKDDSR